MIEIFNCFQTLPFHFNCFSCLHFEVLRIFCNFLLGQLVLKKQIPCNFFFDNCKWVSLLKMKIRSMGMTCEVFMNEVIMEEQGMEKRFEGNHNL